MDNNIGSIIRALRRERHLTQSMFAQELGVSVTVVKNWETNKRYPSRSSQSKICDFFNVDLEYLLGISTIRNRFSVPRKTISVPLYDCGMLSQGISNNYVTDIFELPVFMLRPGIEYLAVRIQDNSMYDTGIRKGDIAVFEKCQSIDNNQIGLFVVNDCVCCRRFVNTNKNKSLITLNHDYPCFYSCDFVILGRLALTIENKQYSYYMD